MRRLKGGIRASVRGVLYTCIVLGGLLNATSLSATEQISATSCQEAAEILQYVFENHYRALRSVDEIRDRLTAAYTRVRHALQPPKSHPSFQLGDFLQQVASSVAPPPVFFRESDRGNTELDCTFADTLAAHAIVPVTPQDVLNLFLDAFLRGLDPHSRLLFSPEGKALPELNRTRVDIGISIQQTKDRRIVVVDIQEKSPAAEAGITVGDEILEVVVGETKLDAKRSPARNLHALLTGPEGEVVELFVRSSDERDWWATVTRRRYEYTWARAWKQEEDILYIRVTQFGRGATRQVEGLIARAGTIRGIVLDLRWNPGGLLDEAVALVDLFETQGVVVSVWDRNDILIEDYNAKDPRQVSDAPMVVLVNNFTASASEIVAQALAPGNFGRALIVGHGPTFGKGSVTMVHAISDGRELHLTRSVYRTVNGESPHFVGVRPDILIPDPLSDMKMFGARMQRRVTRESEYRTAIPPVPALPIQDLSWLGTVDANPTEEILQELHVGKTKLVAGHALVQGTEERPDPAARIARRIVSAYADICPTYRAESCTWGDSSLGIVAAIDP